MKNIRITECCRGNDLFASFALHVPLILSLLSGSMRVWVCIEHRSFASRHWQVRHWAIRTPRTSPSRMNPAKITACTTACISISCFFSRIVWWNHICSPERSIPITIREIFSGRPVTEHAQVARSMGCEQRCCCCSKATVAKPSRIC